MNVEKALAKLNEDQKNAMVAILQKLQNGRKLAKADIEAIGVNLKYVNHKDCANLFDISPRMLHKWVKDGCPKNEDASYNLREVIKWREGRLELTKTDEAKADIEKEKLRKQVRKLELEILEKERKTISRERFEEIQRRQASELMEFLTGGYKRNSQLMMKELGIGADKQKSFNDVMDGWIKAAMDSFVSSGIDINLY